MENNNIRNFCIIAHIDHGKSTLADRLLELTKSVEKRKMKEQFLDQMELERERGITIKMQPVRMEYGNYILNLIDTPGHIDFNYEVSRSLKAVEGVILLVDATQGVQAQTISNLELAKKLGLTIIPVLNKIDSPQAMIEETRKEICNILKCDGREILQVSAKTGEGVEKLLKKIIDVVPSPTKGVRLDSASNSLRAIVFDFDYSPHKGIILFVRIKDGEIKKGDKVVLSQTNKEFSVGETGVFVPLQKETATLKTGEIGYVVTKIKETSIATVGDTLLSKGSKLLPLKGYKKPSPVVWASVYPQSQDDFMTLKQALERLILVDSSLSFEQEESGILGRGFRCGFLGMLHLEIISERLKREFNAEPIVTTPSVVYKVETQSGEVKTIYSPVLFPEYHQISKILEPWVEMQIIIPFDKLNDVMQLLKQKGSMIGETDYFGEDSARLLTKAQMPLREMMGGFFDDLKSVTSGYASLSYELVGEMEGDVVKLEILLNDKVIPAFSKIVNRKDMQREAKKSVGKLKEILPRTLFAIKIQAKAVNRILAAQKLSAMKKDVTGYLYGGDISRKKKLWSKQKKGKKRMKEMGKINVPHEVFLKMIKK